MQNIYLYTLLLLLFTSSYILITSCIFRLKMFKKENKTNWWKVNIVSFCFSIVVVLIFTLLYKQKKSTPWSHWTGDSLLI